MSLKSFQHDVGSSSAQLRVITSGIPLWHTHVHATRGPRTAGPRQASAYILAKACVVVIYARPGIASVKSAEVGVDSDGFGIMTTVKITMTAMPTAAVANPREVVVSARYVS